MTQPVEVTITSPGYWSTRSDELAVLLATSRDRVIDAPGADASANADAVTVVSSPATWAAMPEALEAALRIAAEFDDYVEPADPGATPGAVAPVGDRLVYTVEEAAQLLGISRAFAYEAVQRGEIPSMRIGRRILVPKAALQRMLDA